MTMHVGAVGSVIKALTFPWEPDVKPKDRGISRGSAVQSRAVFSSTVVANASVGLVAHLRAEVWHEQQGVVIYYGIGRSHTLLQ